jgi:monofunctional chorismate mutase
MTKLEEARAGIDQIDAQMSALFEQRFHLVADIINYKIDHHLPIKDSGREEEIAAKNAALIKDDDIRPYFRTCYEAMLEQSRKYQKDYLESK